MTIVELLSQVHNLGIKLWREDDDLRYKDPKGALTPELRAQLVAHKAQILALLTKAAARASGPRLQPKAHTSLLPLSFAQQRLWLLDQLAPGSSVYNIPISMRLTGPLDVPALEWSLNEIVRRHEVMQMRFLVEDGQPIQVPAPDWSISCRLIDLQSLPEPQRTETAAQLSHEEGLLPFDLTQGGLVRALLLQLDVQEHILTLTLHHIIADGWSLGVLIRELAALYEAFCAGTPARLPDLPVQYADYVLWQREWLQTIAADAQRTYWKQQLSGDFSALELPLDHPRLAMPTYTGKNLVLTLSGSLSQALRALSRQEDATLFMTLLTAFKIVLSRYVEHDDIVVGSPVAGRTRFEVNGLIGCFLNTLVLRTDLSGNPSYRDVLRRVRAMLIDSYAYQDLPFEKLVEELLPARDIQRAPLFRVFFNMLNFPLEQRNLGGLSLKVLTAFESAAKFDITLYVREQDEEIRFELVYNADLFKQERMSDLLAQLHYLLAQIIENPDARIGSFSLVTPADDVRLPDPTAVLDVSWAGTIQSMVSQQARRTPAAEAIVDAETSWTYAELDQVTSRIANYLIAQGIRPHDLVAIYAHRSAALVGAVLGILKAGAAFIILDPAYPPARLIASIQIAVPQGWVQIDSAGMVSAEIDAIVATTTITRLTLASDLTAVNSLLAGYSSDDPQVAVGPDDLAYVVFTSGSTGKPKAIAGTHRPLSHFLQWHTHTFALDAADRFSLLSGLAHDPLLRDMFTPLCLGATLCIPDPEQVSYPGWLVEWMQYEAITVAHLTPALGSMMTRTAETGAQLSLRYAFWGGDVLTTGDLALMRALAPAVTCVNFYGTTETPQAVGYYIYPHQVDGALVDGPAAAQLRVPIPIGHGIADVQLLVLNAAQQLAGISELGEIHVRTPYLSQGYLNDPVATSDRFLTNPYTNDPHDRLYKTGDLGRYLPDGAVLFCGRADQQVKIRGFRVELDEIRAWLYEYPAVQDCAVLLFEDPPNDKEIVAYIVLQRPDCTISEIHRFLSTKLPMYMVPSVFVMLDALPLTPNGKLDRQALPPPKQSRPNLDEIAVAPHTPIEVALVSLWAEVLGLGGIGIHDNFFTLGGHSLLVTRIIARVRETFQVEVPLSCLFQRPTVAELAEWIEAAQRADQVAQVLPLQRIKHKTAPRASFAQERMWLINQLDPHSAAYNISTIIRLRGQLDVAALERALNELVKRHEMLRTTFASVEDMLVQIITPPQPMLLTQIYLSAESVASREEQIERLTISEVQQPFDLVGGPLLRVTLLHGADEDHALLLIMHHIVADGWSTEVFIRELAILYDDFRKQQAVSLPDLAIQYADFAEWQRRWLQGPVLEKHLAYWRQQLRNIPPALALPTDRPRSALQTFHGARYPFLLAQPLAEASHALSQREGSTLFMTMLTAFLVLLFRYTGEDDIVIGTPIAGRTQVATEKLIGFFVNTLVLRADLSGGPSFVELLRRVREMTTDAYSHQSLPFEKLVEDLQPMRDLSRSPVFQVMFILQNVPLPPRQLSDLTLEFQAVDTKTAQFDLTLVLTEVPEGIQGRFEYNTDLFDAATIARMAGHFQTIVSGIVARPACPIMQLPLLTLSERQQLLVEWNTTACSYAQDTGVHQLFEAQVARTPQAIAVVFGENHLTYQELDARANQLAHHLRGLAVGPETRVGLYLDRSIDLVIGLLGVLKAGAAYVPLDPSYPAERLQLIINDAQVAALLTHAQIRSKLPPVAATILSLDADWCRIALEPISTPIAAVDPKHPAYLIYTSGSTGQPKGVVVPHGALVNHMQWMLSALPLTTDDRVLQKTPFSFDAAVWEFYAPLLAGAQLILSQPGGHQDPAYLVRTIQQEHITVLQVVPTLLHLLLEEPAFAACRTLRRIFCGGETLPRAWAEHCSALLPTVALYNLYGPTEATIDTTFGAWHVEQRGMSVPIGRPIAQAQVYILDAQQQPMPIGVAGELYIGGAGLARGYHNRPDLTAEKFLPDPYSTVPGARLYRTGDRARFFSDGSIEFLGRLDQQIKLRGYRIEIGEIEAVLATHPQVKECVVMVRQDGPADTRLVAYVTEGHISQESSTRYQNASIRSSPVAVDEYHAQSNGLAKLGAREEGLRYFLQSHVPDYMIPSAFVFLDALPLMPNGKLDRKALPTPPLPNGAPVWVAPRTPLEELIAGVWAAVLKIERVGITDNFFALGGHSLLATQVISRLRHVLQRDLSVRLLFEAPTVAAFSAQLGFHAPLEEVPLVAVPRDGRRLPLSFAQQRLWFLDQLQPDSAFYTISWAVRLIGSLDRLALERSLGALVARHEVFRTTFAFEPTESPEAWQQIAPPSDFVLPYVVLPAVADDTMIRDRVQAVNMQPFDLREGPLLRAVLFQHHSTEHILALAIHHSIFDGWSQAVLVSELTDFYHMFAHGRDLMLSALPIQYADYSLWQRQWLQGQVLDAQLDYWRQQLADISHLDLPIDHPRPPIFTQRGAHIAFHLSAALTVELQHLSQRLGCTLFMTLLAAWQTLLHRYSGQDDIVVGTPIAGRTQPELEHLIGFFVNTLVLRTDFSGAPGFPELVARVRAMTLDAYAHQDVPFELLVKELQPMRDLSRTPLFQVMFTLQNTPLATIDLGELKLEPFSIGATVVKFDLMLTLSETAQGLVGTLEYCTDLFDAATIDRMATHYQRLLEAIVVEPEQRIDRLPLLTEHERQLIDSWSAGTTATWPDRLVPELFADHARHTPDALALVQGAEQLTYDQLNRRANQLAHHLATLGVGHEIRVGVCLDRSVDLVIALLALLKAGAVYVPLDPSAPAARLASLLADVQAPVVLSTAQHQALTQNLPARVLDLDTAATLIAQQLATNPRRTIHSEQLAYVIYTSGSTGTPKGVGVSHAAIAQHVLSIGQIYALNTQDRVLHFASPSFDVSIEQMLTPLLHGACLVVRDAELWSPQQFTQALEHAGLTVINLPPVYYREWVQAVARTAAPAPGQLRLVLVGGEALPPDVVQLWHRTALAPIRLLNAYGPTETTITATVFDLANAAASDHTIPIGRPVGERSAYMLDAAGAVVPVGIPGELYIGGALLARGYLGRPDLTAERFLPDPFAQTPGSRLYRTGDRARYRADGTLEFLGRIDHQVKLRGFRIELGEIEATLRTHPAVQEAVAIVREDRPGDRQLVAFVVTGEPTERQESAAALATSQDAPHTAPEMERRALGATLRRLAQQVLPSYMVPSVIMVLDALPMTKNGKLNRHALTKLNEGYSRTEVAYVAPVTEVEQKLAAIWQVLLGVERVGIHDNFFDLGGHSLLAIQVVSRIRQTFQIKLLLGHLFEAVTVADLAQTIETITWATRDQAEAFAPTEDQREEIEL